MGLGKQIAVQWTCNSCNDGVYKQYSDDEAMAQDSALSDDMQLILPLPPDGWLYDSDSDVALCPTCKERCAICRNK